MRENMDYLERDTDTGNDGMSRNMESTIRCPECGRVAQAEDDVCSECGAILDYCMAEEELEDDSVYVTEEDDMGFDTSDAQETPYVHVQDNELGECDQVVIRFLEIWRKKLEEVHRHHKKSSRTYHESWDGSVQAMFSKWVDAHKQVMSRLYYLLMLKNKRLRIADTRDMVEESLSTPHPVDDAFIRACLATLKVKGTEQDHFVQWFHTREW